MSKRRKGIRNLATNNKTSISYKVKLFQSIGSAILIGILSWMIVKNPNILDDFICSYHEQYHLVVHGTSDYCSRFFDYSKLLENIRENIYGQEEALDQIETIFKDRQNLTSISIIGTTGVGKTHFLNLIRSFYPWQDNIHHYVWSSFEESNEKKFLHIHNILNRLSSCGYNLILIDGFTSSEKTIVLKYQQMIENYLLNQKRSLKLIVIYVFNILQYTEHSRKMSVSSLQKLQNLENIKTINFKELKSIDVKKCIEKTASNLGMNLNSKQIEQIVNSIDIPLVGCKNVHAKFTKNIKQ